MTHNVFGGTLNLAQLNCCIMKGWGGTRARRPSWAPCVAGYAGAVVKAAFHDTDIDTDSPETRDFLELFLWQADRGSRPTRRHRRDDPREDVGVSVSWDAAFTPPTGAWNLSRPLVARAYRVYRRITR